MISVSLFSRIYYTYCRDRISRQPPNPDCEPIYKAITPAIINPSTLPKPAIGATIAIAALLELLPIALAVEEPVALVEPVLPVVVPVAAGIEEPAEEAEASACSQSSAAAGATSVLVLDNVGIVEAKAGTRAGAILIPGYLRRETLFRATPWG